MRKKRARYEGWQCRAAGQGSKPRWPVPLHAGPCLRALNPVPPLCCPPPPDVQLQLCPQGADSPRLLVQSCIKQKRPVAQVPQVQMGAKAPGQQSRLAQGMSTDGSAKGGAAGAAATKTGEWTGSDLPYLLGWLLGGGEGCICPLAPQRAWLHRCLP